MPLVWSEHIKILSFQAICGRNNDGKAVWDFQDPISSFLSHFFIGEQFFSPCFNHQARCTAPGSRELMLKPKIPQGAGWCFHPSGRALLPLDLHPSHRDRSVRSRTQPPFRNVTRPVPSATRSQTKDSSVAMGAWMRNPSYPLAQTFPRTYWCHFPPSYFLPEHCTEI